MTEQEDPLEGFRGNPEPDPAAVLRDRMGEHADLVEVFQLGEAVKQFVNHHPVGKYLNARAHEDLAASTEQIFGASDTTSKEFQAAHFKGRVAIRLLQLIDEAVQAGEGAERVIAGNESTGV